MKQVFALAAYVLLAALCGAGAQDLNQLELGTHDLAEIKTLTGVTLVFDPTRIVRFLSCLERSVRRPDVARP